MAEKKVSLRIHDKEVVDWLDSKKKPGHSVNTEINDALIAAMKKDKNK